MTRLEKLIEQLACDFGKVTRWQVLCEEQNATTEDHQIELAEQVLSEWSTGTVAGGYAQWARLHGARDRAAPPYTPTGF